MHALLLAVRESASRGSKYKKKGSAAGVLINTSLNGKGVAITADAAEALLLFCQRNGAELDYVLLEEEWLFPRQEAIGRGLCAEHTHYVGQDHPGRLEHSGGADAPGRSGLRHLPAARKVARRVALRGPRRAGAK